MSSPRPTRPALPIRAFSSGPNLTDIALETAIPGLNAGLQALIDQHRTTLAALQLNEIYLSFKHRMAPQPPAPRLVCVETNPGPNGRIAIVKRRNPARGARGTADSIRDMVAATGAALGIAAANATKKKKKNKNSSSLTLSSGSFRTLAAPAAVGTMIRRTSSLSHSPFIVRGTALACQVQQITSATTLNLVTATGAGSTTGIFSLDPAGTGVNANDFDAFPATIRNIFTSFLRYRWRKLVARYVPIVPTTDAHSIGMGVVPEVRVANTTFSMNSLAATQVNTQFSSWATASLNLLQDGGLRKEWLYIDSAAAAQASLRQESAGSLFFAVLGSAPIATVTYGAVYLDFEMELDGLGSDAFFGLGHPADHAAPSSSSSSSLPASAANPQYSQPPLTSSATGPNGWFRA